MLRMVVSSSIEQVDSSLCKIFVSHLWNIAHIPLAALSFFESCYFLASKSSSTHPPLAIREEETRWFQCTTTQ